MEKEEGGGEHLLKAVQMWSPHKATFCYTGPLWEYFRCEQLKGQIHSRAADPIGAVLHDESVHARD